MVSEFGKLIDAEALKKWLKSPTGFRANCEDCTSIDCLDCIIEEAIENAPTVDAVEVVRCKDCKHFDMQHMECQCDAIVSDNEGGADFSVNFCPDDFCSYGERKASNV